MDLGRERSRFLTVTAPVRSEDGEPLYRCSTADCPDLCESCEACEECSRQVCDRCRFTSGYSGAWLCSDCFAGYERRCETALADDLGWLSD